MNHLAVPVLHSSGEYPTGFLHSNWTPAPTVVVGVIALIAAYVVTTGRLNRRRPDAAVRLVRPGQIAAFLGGSLLLLIVLAPPLDDWADRYLLSVHMFQHLTMMFAVAPLWLIGTPAWLLEPMLGRPLLRRAGYVLTRPVAAFVVGNLIVAIWHLPGPYDAALRHEALHVVQHLSFLVAALLVWWPVLGPLPAWPRLSPPVQCLYLFLESIPGSIIGAFITLAAPGVYDFYDRAPRIWGIDLATDQQMAGLLMWVGAQLLYLLWITIVFFQWASGEETKEWSGVGQQPRAFNRQPPSARVAPGRLSGSR